MQIDVSKKGFSIGANILSCVEIRNKVLGINVQIPTRITET